MAKLTLKLKKTSFNKYLMDFTSVVILTLSTLPIFYSPVQAAPAIPPAQSNQTIVTNTPHNARWCNIFVIPYDRGFATKELELYVPNGYPADQVYFYFKGNYIPQGGDTIWPQNLIGRRTIYGLDTTWSWNHKGWKEPGNWSAYYKC